MSASSEGTFRQVRGEVYRGDDRNVACMGGLRERFNTLADDMSEAVASGHLGIDFGFSLSDSTRRAFVTIAIYPDRERLHVFTRDEAGLIADHLERTLSGPNASVETAKALAEVLFGLRETVKAWPGPFKEATP